MDWTGMSYLSAIWAYLFFTIKYLLLLNFETDIQ